MADGWTDGWKDGQMEELKDGRLDIHLSILQDIGPFGPLPKKEIHKSGYISMISSNVKQEDRYFGMFEWNRVVYRRNRHVKSDDVFP